ncbi:polyprenyl synthetase family protein [Endomicrobium proavitum]|uniref:Geranyltranstransferase n=1 Tax=Endomicrobium proavitum TaxID=1408281 RepID=A0A0G3WJD1_9BACT|nr:farnesyl diphosphate synthase [Endomicrobium proavitum]AKL97594.1 geranyltranstransferase [Endomicrobium proavitum]
MINLKDYLSKQAAFVNSSLKKYLPKDNSIISQAMRYSVLAGGKRLRPIFVILSAELFGAKASKIIPAACALEYLHTYSLVHDDLPAMDNDDLRRGMPTNHKKFGEAAAILCGDALLTESFNLLTKADAKEKNINEAIRILADLSGFKGMIAGQAADTLEAGRWSKKNKALLKKKLRFIQLNKTAALLTASLKVGAVLAGADKKSVKALENYGRNIGYAFQIADDILDVYADKKLLGKKGSDRDNDKLTELSLYGKEAAVKHSESYVKSAKNAVKIFGKKADILIELADYMTKRAY